MTEERPYPEEPVGPFPTPPATFTDGEGREIELRSLDDGAADPGTAGDHDSVATGPSGSPDAVGPTDAADTDDRGAGPGDARDDSEAALAALADMYERFDPADRAQGIPPTGRERIESWLSTLADTDTVNVLAWHGEEVAGHATLVPDGSGAYELAIFVHQDYQRAGVGGKLIRHLMGEGARRGVERVWLTVERWNEAAIGLYRDVGFERTGADRFETEMSVRLA